MLPRLGVGVTRVFSRAGAAKTLPVTSVTSDQQHVYICHVSIVTSGFVHHVRIRRVAMVASDRAPGPHDHGDQ